MTRLSEALKRAADTSGDSVMPGDAGPAPGWQFTGEGRLAQATPEPVLRVAEAPAFVPVPLATRFNRDESARLVVSADAEPALVEQYRHLAAVLHHAQAQSGYRSVMVTSALPSEGKTLTATNLALTLSESYQRRVLLIDADLRRPRIKDMFRLPDGEGLSDSLNRPGETYP